MEIFGILSRDKEPILKTVQENYQDLCAPYFSPKPQNNNIRTQSGTCPFSGREYLHIVIDSLKEIDVKKILRFQENVYSRHTCKDEALVKDNMLLRLEDSECEEINQSKLDELADEDETEMNCWICGRIDGEEYYDTETHIPYNVEVKFRDVARVPLCSVCLELFLNHDDWKPK
jgi:hypothetical protein